jgi:hypothetical protein
MALKANLRIKLYADDNIVAEIDDAPLQIWQQLLAHSGGLPIDVPSPRLSPPPPVVPSQTAVEVEIPATEIIKERSASGQTPLQKMAAYIGVAEDSIISALDPTPSAPHIALEHTYWEAFRTNNPATGHHAVAPVTVAATLLALWKMHAPSAFTVDVALIKKVLNPVDGLTANAARSIRNCIWLKQRPDGEIVIIPDTAKHARELAAAFCQKRAISHSADA